MTTTLAPKFQRPSLGTVASPRGHDPGATMPTLRTRLRICLLSLPLAAAAACATTGTNHYRPAVSSQESCCHRLADPNAQRACLAEIPRTQDETSPINQETFQCVEKYFACDAT